MCFMHRSPSEEESLRNNRDKICLNVMPKNGPRAARISEWNKSEVDSSFISRSRSWLTISKQKTAGRLLTSGIPVVSAEPRIDKALLLYRGKKSAKPHRTNQKKTGESGLYL